MKGAIIQRIGKLFFDAVQKKAEKDKGVEAMSFKEFGSEKPDGAGFLGADGLDMDAELFGGFTGRFMMDEQEPEDLAAFFGEGVDLLVYFMEQFDAEDLALEGFVGVVGAVLEQVGDAGMDVAMGLLGLGVVDAGIADGAVEKGAGIVEGGEFLAAIPDFEEGFGGDILGGRQLAGETFGEEGDGAKVFFKKIRLRALFATLEGGPQGDIVGVMGQILAAATQTYRNLQNFGGGDGNFTVLSQNKYL